MLILYAISFTIRLYEKNDKQTRLITLRLHQTSTKFCYFDYVHIEGLKVANFVFEMRVKFPRDEF